MALLGNYSVLNKSPGRYLGGNSATTVVLGGPGALGGLVQQRGNWQNSGSRMGRFTSDDYLDESAVPDGYRPPYGWMLPLKAGAIAAHTYGINGTGSITVTLAGGKYLTADISGVGSLTGDIGLIVSLVAALDGTGTLTGDIFAALDVAAALSGSSSLTGDLGALAGLAAALSGTGTLSGLLTGPAFISADILPYTDLSPEALARAVWSEEQAGYTTAGTFGDNLDEPISTIGGGSITESGIADAVWDEALADHSTAGSTGAFMQKILTVAKFLGLK